VPFTPLRTPLRTPLKKSSLDPFGVDVLGQLFVEQRDVQAELFGVGAKVLVAQATLVLLEEVIFIGATPSTQWIDGQLAEDDHGFLLNGSDIPATYLDGGHPSLLFLETSRPGIFCVGDVRSGSVKRAATAIGEGSMAVRLVFERLQKEKGS